MNKGKLLLFVVVVALAAGLVYFLGRKGAASPPGTAHQAALPAASVDAVTKGTLFRSLRVAGQFTAYQDVDLHAKVSGYIRKITVDIGDRVRAGQTIAVLEVPELSAQLVGSEAAVRHSRSEIARARSEVSRSESGHAALHAAYTRLKQASEARPGLVAQQELDDAQAKDLGAEEQIAAAKSALEAAEQTLAVSRATNDQVRALSNYTTVTAPFDGVVTKRYADTGALIQAGTTSSTQAMPVVRVAQSSLLRLRMPVPESDVHLIRVGSPVTITVQAVNRTVTAPIVRFTRSLDEGTRTMIAEVDIKNPDLSLSPGMYADTQIVLEQHKDALGVANPALVGDGAKRTVLVVDKDDRVRRVTITTGIAGDQRTEVLQGLAEGDRVITSGQSSYQDGEQVRPIANPLREGADEEQ